MHSIVVVTGVSERELSPEPRHLSERGSVGRQEIERLLGRGRSFGRGPLVRILEAGVAGDATVIVIVDAATGEDPVGTLVEPLRASARDAKVEGETRKRRESRDARIAEVEVRATTVTLRPPYRPDRKLPEVTVNVVLVEETNPPHGATPIQWLLITTLPIDDPEQIAAGCIEQVTAIAENCAERNAAGAERCVARIEELLTAGEVDEAAALAEHCTERTNRGSDGCVRHIEHMGQRCAALLVELEEPDLAEEVTAACTAAAEVVVASQDAAVAAIAAALGTT